MPKNILNDIKPMSRTTRSPKVDVENAPIKKTRVSRLPKEVPYVPIAPTSTRGNGLWYIAAALIIGLLFALSFLFERATVTIIPHELPVSFDAADVFSATKDSVDEGVISFTEMTLTGSESIKLPSTDSKVVSVPAEGTVILYNTYSTSTYKLVKSTRLKTPDGKIYRISSAASIPGYTKQGGQIVPGSVEAHVVADVPGEAGNVENVDFSVPGLSGTAQATRIYARSKTSISGGVSGQMYLVPKDAVDTAATTLGPKLKASLTQKAKAQIPEGYTFFEGASVFEAEEPLGSEYSKDPEIPVVVSGTLTIYLINEKSFLQTVASRFVSQYDGSPVTIPELSSFSFIPSDDLNPKTDTTFDFTLRGSGMLVWVVDESEVKTTLAGKKKNALEELLKDIVSIERADVVIRPFWKQTFPKNTSHITINVNK